MLNIRKRGQFFHVDLVIGTKRVRGSLGTHNQDAARRLLYRLGTALSEGAGSPLWQELGKVLPHLTFARFANLVGVKEPRVPTWGDLEESFKMEMDQRVSIGKLRESTASRYEVTLREFGVFLSDQAVTLLSDINKQVVERFKIWRIERIRKKKQSRGGAGLVLDAAILHRVFALAMETEMILKNPVRMEGRPGRIRRTVHSRSRHLTSPN